MVKDQLNGGQSYAYQVSSSSSRYVSWGAMMMSVGGNDDGN